MTTPKERIEYYLQANPIAGKGNLPFKVENMPPLAEAVMNLQWKVVAKIDISGYSYKVIKLNDQDIYCVGYLELTNNKEEALRQFTRVLWMKLTPVPELDSLGYLNLRRVEVVSVATELQGSKLGRSMYKLLVKCPILL